MKITIPAKFISQIGHPVVLFPLALILLFASQNAWVDLIVVMSCTFGLPFLYFLRLFISKKISDFDVSNREQRYPLYAVSLAGMLLSLAFLYYSMSSILFYEFLRLFCVAITLVCINFKIKVSIHTACAMLVATILVEFYSWSSLIFILVLIIGSSRLILKRHSLTEVGLGILVPMLFFLTNLFPASAP